VTVPGLEELRRAIDDIDRKILELVTERVGLVLRVGDLKRSRDLPIHDPDRERALLDHLATCAVPPLDAHTVRRIFERVVVESRRLEQQHTSAERGAGTSHSR
jgi:chorismate mutase